MIKTMNTSKDRRSFWISRSVWSTLVWAFLKRGSKSCSLILGSWMKTRLGTGKELGLVCPFVSKSSSRWADQWMLRASLTRELSLSLTSRRNVKFSKFNSASLLTKKSSKKRHPHLLSKGRDGRRRNWSSLNLSRNQRMNWCWRHAWRNRSKSIDLSRTRIKSSSFPSSSANSRLPKALAKATYKSLLVW